VLVNGKRITEEQLLCDGDEIKIGDTFLAYYHEDNPDRSNALEQFKRASRELREDRTVGG
jgi:pSer/pThr/pTyr-binding forkhead associated (FHA) protein